MIALIEEILSISLEVLGKLRGHSAKWSIFPIPLFVLEMCICFSLNILFLPLCRVYCFNKFFLHDKIPQEVVCFYELLNILPNLYSAKSYPLFHSILGEI